MIDTARARTRSKCRCGHYDSEHGQTTEQQILGTSLLMPWECRLCDCPGFHTTHYKKRISALRSAARELRGQPLQPRLFPLSPNDQHQKAGDPANPTSAKKRRPNP